MSYQLEQLELDDLVVVMWLLLLQTGAEMAQRKVVYSDTQLGLLLGVHTPREQLDEQEGQVIAALRCLFEVLKVLFDGIGLFDG